MGRYSANYYIIYISIQLTLLQIRLVLTLLCYNRAYYIVMYYIHIKTFSSALAYSEPMRYCLLCIRRLLYKYGCREA